MENNFDNIDDLFREGFADMAETPPGRVWDALEKRLDQDKRRRVFPFRWYWFIGLMAFITLMGASISWKMSDKNPRVSTRPTAATLPTRESKMNAEEVNNNINNISSPGKTTGIGKTNHPTKKETPETTEEATTTNSKITATNYTSTSDNGKTDKSTTQTLGHREKHAGNKTPVKKRHVRRSAQNANQPVKDGNTGNTPQEDHLSANAPATGTSVYSYDDFETDEPKTADAPVAAANQGTLAHRTKHNGMLVVEEVPLAAAPPADENISAASAHIAKVETPATEEETNDALADNDERESLTESKLKTNQPAPHRRLASTLKAGMKPTDTKSGTGHSVASAHKPAKIHEDVTSSATATATTARHQAGTKQVAAKVAIVKKTTQNSTGGRQETAQNTKQMLAANTKQAATSVKPTTAETARPKTVDKKAVTEKESSHQLATTVAEHFAAKPQVTTAKAINPAINGNKALAVQAISHTELDRLAPLPAALPVVSTGTPAVASLIVIPPFVAEIAPESASFSSATANIAATKNHSTANELPAVDDTDHQAHVAGVSGQAPLASVTSKAAMDMIANSSPVGKPSSNTGAARGVSPTTPPTGAALRQTGPVNITSPAPARARVSAAPASGVTLPPVVQAHASHENAAPTDTATLLTEVATTNSAPKKTSQLKEEKTPEEQPTEDSTADTHKSFGQRFVAGIKAGYEGTGGNWASHKGIFAPFFQYKLNDKFSLMLQPAFKTSFTGRRTIGSPLKFYDVNQGSGSYQFADSQLVLLHLVADTLWKRNYTYTETHDSVVKTYRTRGTYIEIELPLLLNYQLSPRLSVYGGINTVYGKTLGIKEETTTTRDIAVTGSVYTLANIHAAAPAVTGTGIVYQGSPLSGYAGPQYPDQQKGLLRMGYMLGFSYEIRKRWMADLTIQQCFAKQNIQAGVDVNQTLSKPYFRFTIGYRLTGKK